MSTESAWKFYVTTAITILLALSGYLYTWFQAKETAQYQARLDRVNQQLREFYGPLHSLMEGEERSFQEFVRATRPGKLAFWIDEDPPTSKQQEAWRRWITEVTMPNYLAIEQIIQKRSDLILESAMPQELLDLEAHIAGYKPVVAGWRADDFSRNFSFFNFPQQARAHVRERYKQLKEEQWLLLGKVYR